VTVFANAACGLEVVDAIPAPKRTDDELCNHERRVDWTSALREVEEVPAAAGVLQLVLKAPATPNADDDSRSSVLEVMIFMVKYCELVMST